MNLQLAHHILDDAASHWNCLPPHIKERHTAQFLLATIQIARQLMDSKTVGDQTMNEPFSAGPTGDFPRGKLNGHDEGGLNVAVATDYQKGVVILHFGVRISWLGLPPKEAREFAKMLIARADELETKA
jgi:hypothetical protein